MTGPQHYREAQNLVEAAAGWIDDGARPERVEVYLRKAQVHATLALAAATALAAYEVMPDPDRRRWDDAAGEQPGGAA